MSAKEMFEKLGYVERPENEYATDAIKIYDNDKKLFGSVYFDYDKKIDLSGAILSLELLQAINKQVEELGWGDK